MSHTSDASYPRRYRHHRLSKEPENHRRQLAKDKRGNDMIARPIPPTHYPPREHHRRRRNPPTLQKGTRRERKLAHIQTAAHQPGRVLRMGRRIHTGSHQSPTRRGNNRIRAELRTHPTQKRRGNHPKIIVQIRRKTPGVNNTSRLRYRPGIQREDKHRPYGTDGRTLPRYKPLYQPHARVQGSGKERREILHVRRKSLSLAEMQHHPYREQQRRSNHRAYAATQKPRRRDYIRKQRQSDESERARGKIHTLRDLFSTRNTGRTGPDIELPEHRPRRYGGRHSLRHK